MELLVAEETVGYGTCLEVDSTSPRYLNLVPLMHQIPANGCLALDYGSSSEGCAGPTAISRPGAQRPGGRDRLPEFLLDTDRKCRLEAIGTDCADDPCRLAAQSVPIASKRH